MRAPGFALVYALRSLRRGGQRSLLALLCIAFGVFALVALRLLAGMIHDAVLVDPRYKLGGDLAVASAAGPLAPAQLDTLARWQAEGRIDAYTLTADNRQHLLLKTDGTGRVAFLRGVTGVDPAAFPLLGAAEVAGAPSFAAALAGLGDAVLSRDLVQGRDVAVGDSVTLVGLGGAPVRLRVGGIAQVMPDRAGSSVYYSLATARRLAPLPAAPTRALLRASGAGALEADALEAAGWRVSRPADATDRRVVDLFDFMLGGAGILGLLIGGIGVASTMHVLLARRTLEIATLKTVGYRQGDLMALFGLEALLLGVAGSVVGAAAALGLAHGLMQLMNRSLSFTLVYAVDPWTVAGGLAAGVVTTLLFAFRAILRSGRVRPATLLRDLPLPASARTRLQEAGLWGVLLLLFSGLSSAVLGSWTQGVGVVLGGLGGVVLVGAVLGALLQGLVRAPVHRVPILGGPLLGLARRNLRHRPLRAVVSLVALFVGVFAIGFAASAVFSALGQLQARSMSAVAQNLTVYGRAADAEALARLADAHGVDTVRSRIVVPAEVTTAAGAPLPVAALEGRPPAYAAWQLAVDSAAVLGDGGAFVPASLRERVAVGDTLLVTAAHGQASVRVDGFYEARRGFAVLRTTGLVTHAATARRLGGPDAAATYALSVPLDALDAAADAVGRALPAAVVLSLRDLNAFVNTAFINLFWFVAAVAGLALVAGVVLIANAVGLSMLERRREVGVFKALGYTSSAVLRTVLLENALLGLLAGAAGVAAVAAAAAVINRMEINAHLALTAGQAGALVLLAVLLAAGSAAAVAWHPTRVRPLTVLRGE